MANSPYGTTFFLLLINFTVMWGRRDVCGEWGFGGCSRVWKEVGEYVGVGKGW
jgi:hypothetical protein